MCRLKKKWVLKFGSCFLPVLFVFLLLQTSAAAQQLSDMPYTSDSRLLLINLDKNWKIDSIKVIRDNYYYKNYGGYAAGLAEDYDTIEDEDYPYIVDVLDSDGEILSSSNTLTKTVSVSFIEGISGIKVYDTYDGILSLVEEEEINFCNSNGVCEACNKGYCRVMENSASCNDCGSGSKDFYCDLKKDGICDPDCNGIDMDCLGCTEEKCYYEDSIDQGNMCGSFGEELCSTFEECAGTVTYADEKGYCCDGNCVDPTVDEEYAEEEPVDVEFTGGSDYVDESEDTIMDSVELFNMNYNNSIPVDDESNKILCSKIGKSVCGQFQECTGQRVYSDDEGDDCCTGDCVPVPEKQFRQEYKEIFGEDYNPVFEEAASQKGLTQYIPVPTIEKPAAEGMSPWWLLLVALALFGIMLLYNFERKKGSETAKRIQNEYNYYGNYGYNDEQIKTILAQRGWAKKDIKKVIKR